MKTIALISGGKDSILSVLLALRYGYQPVVVANIAPTCSAGPEHVHEIDSYSFQTVGHEVVQSIGACMQLPLRRAYIRAGQSKVQELHYTRERDDEDEIECLYRLLRSIKEEFPEVEGVTTGAILSHYQRYRVEDVCERLGISSIAFLWQRPADEVLDMASALRVRAILVKTASIGLNPRTHLGKTLQDVRPALEKAEQLYGTHSAGEGGEFETIVLDCPLFKEQCLEVVALEPVIVDDNEYSPSGHALLKVKLRDKTSEERDADTDLLRKLPTLVFPSDHMAHLPSPERMLQVFTGPMEPAACSIPSEDNTSFWSCACDVYNSEPLTTEDSVECCSEGVLQQVVEDMARKSREVFFLLVLAPSVRHASAFYHAFGRLFPDVKPPGCTFVERSELLALRVEALSAPRCSINRSAMHMRSISCFAAASMGPYSLVNAVTVGNERRTLVSGCIGLVPVTQLLATADEMPELLSIPLSSVCGVLSVEEDLLRAFIAQFAFMYANSVAGLSHFGADGTTPTHATFLLRDMRFTPLLSPLWQWCTNSPTRLVPWADSQTCALGDGLVCRVFKVTQLQSCAMVGVILERRAPRLDD
ncbi:putative ATP-binding protein [Trypanosoma grayi]|uniref:putative ATP-binding protein n=1 Tax=Trypanosoma grayi TaxID=71804 RepID=UPI0004F48971|nr:putative ATP-binding protein [Trypanosoma grayi]KEG12586.1 putative ATP-binding protein [Trypanosoma grayi]